VLEANEALLRVLCSTEADVETSEKILQMFNEQLSPGLKRLVVLQAVAKNKAEMVEDFRRFHQNFHIATVAKKENEHGILLWQ